jgi:succinate dehydrogenase / fumarate reductase cytochrome b subunit
VEAAPRSSFLARHEFLIRRLHSLSGLVPVGAYMAIHLATNATVLNGPESFQEKVDTIHGLGQFLPAVEWAFVFLPIIFHAVIGVMMIAKIVPNTGSYPYTGNIRYILQRATGMIAFAFILWHVLHMHPTLGAPFEPMGGAQFDHHAATSTAAGALQAHWWVSGLYLVGLAACVFHLANGLWTMGITWGVWTTPAAQRRANWVAIGAGMVLGSLAFAAWWGMVISADVGQARIYERVRAEMEEELQQRMRDAEQPARERPADEPEQSAGGPSEESLAQQEAE